MSLNIHTHCDNLELVGQATDRREQRISDIL